MHGASLGARKMEEREGWEWEAYEGKEGEK